MLDSIPFPPALCRLDPVTQLLNFLFIDSDLWYVDFIIRWYIVYWAARRFAPCHTGKILAAFGLACLFMEQLMAEQAFSFMAGYMASAHYDKVRSWDRRKVALVTACAFAYGTLFIIVKELPAVRQYIGTLPVKTDGRSTSYCSTSSCRWPPPCWPRPSCCRD